MNNDSIELIVVHGTWAAGRLRGERPRVESTPVSAVWDLLVETIRSAAPNCRVSWLRWSGRNSVRDRRRAAAALAAYIRRSRRERPGSRFVLIGHSHGGTVIFHSARRLVAAGALAGLVCLSTPFISVSLRGLREELLFYSAGLTAGMVCVSYATRNLPLSSRFGWASGAFAALGLTLGAIWKRAYASAIRFLRQATLPDLSGAIPVLLVRSPRDEATLALAFSQAGTSAAVAFTKFFLVAKPRPRGGHDLPIGAMLLAYVYSAGLAAIWFEWWKPADPAVYWWWFTSVITAIGCFTVGVAFCSAAVFSRDFLAGALILHGSVESTPPGQWVVRQLPPPARASTKPLRLTDVKPKSPWARRILSVLTVLLELLGRVFPISFRDHPAERAGLWHSATYLDREALVFVREFLARDLGLTRG